VNDALDAHGVAEFLDLKNRDVAIVGGVAPTSVRFDEKMPTDMRER
jgi:hypothetical protein